MKMFEKKYRVISNDTGPGSTWLYRSKYLAGYWAAFYEYVEWRAGIASNGWKVQERVKKDSPRYAYLQRKGRVQ
jgi:hypothetical protein